MNPHLRVRFEADPDAEDIGELFVEVSAPPFAGASSAWFNAADVLLFAERLAVAYPLSASDPVELRGGIFSSDVKVLEQVLVGLSFYALGARGNIACGVRLATPTSSAWPTHRSVVETELLTSYEGVQSFALALRAAVENRATEAILAPHES